MPIQISNFFIDFRDVETHGFNTLFIGVHLLVNIVVSILSLNVQHSSERSNVIDENELEDSSFILSVFIRNEVIDLFISKFIWVHFQTLIMNNIIFEILIIS